MLAYEFSKVEKWQLRTLIESSLSEGIVFNTPKYFYNGDTQTEEETDIYLTYPLFSIAVDIVVFWESREECNRWLKLCSGKGYQREQDLKEWVNDFVIR